jgi:predicted DNA-binding protein
MRSEYKISLRIPGLVKARICKQAEDDKRSQAFWIRRALEKAMRRSLDEPTYEQYVPLSLQEEGGKTTKFGLWIEGEVREWLEGLVRRGGQSQTYWVLRAIQDQLSEDMETSRKDGEEADPPQTR